jgi:putative nucleotidyltransferase with HDIG domain
MTQILFVDDDVQVLDGLRVSLRKQRQRWGMRFAVGGAAALETLRANPVDVIVSDMRMPGMDGPALLQQVQKEFPSVIRIVLSGQAGIDAVARALPVSHRFLSKPCDGEVLRSVLERAADLRACLRDNAISRITGSSAKLPSPASLYWDLAKATLNAEVSCAAIAAIIERDRATSARLLQLVNSGHLELEHELSDVQSAVAHLGLEQVRSLTLLAQIWNALEPAPPVAGFSLERLLVHALLTARVARQIPVDALQKEEAFAAALLHDVGKAVFALVAPDEMAQIVRGIRHQGRRALSLEKEILGVTHTEMGAYLLTFWGLPMPIIEAVAYHHEPRRVPLHGLDALAAVHIANTLVNARVMGACGVLEDEPLDPSYLQSLGVAARLPSWTNVVTSRGGPRSSKKQEAGGP